MAFARAWSVALSGLEGSLVEVAADLANGLPALTVTGLPDAALAEARDRLRAAVVNSGERWPTRRITLGLSPASLRKRGTGFDLAMAAALLAADGAVPAPALADRVLIGELGLDGSVRGVLGVLPALLAAKRQALFRAVVPTANLAEARLLPDMDVIGVGCLRDLLDVLRGRPVAQPIIPAPTPLCAPVGKDMADVAGQAGGRAAMEVVAAGGHHALLVGPPGSGKTMLAERLPGLLPPLEIEAALEVTALHSLAGRLPAGEPLISRAPFQDPHHTATVAAVIGGGSRIARPGAASLASHGVLFLDEAPEFARPVLDALRQPLESGRLRLARVDGTAEYPAAFTLLLAANPCPCGKPHEDCSCPLQARRRYLARLSGPLLDRVDVQLAVNRITRAELMAEDGRGEPTAAMAARVAHARRLASRRYAGTPWRTNGQVPPAELRRHWPLRRAAIATAEQAVDRGLLTARGFGRVLRMAWTLADLADAGTPGPEHVGHALGLRLGGWRALS